MTKITRKITIKIKKKLKKINLEFFNWFFLLTTPSSDGNLSFWELCIKFYKIWPLGQWLWSILSLILIYWMSGYFYNKYLSKKKAGWMDTKTRILMIVLDLFLNFALGIYYMNHRDTFLGTLMVQCPVFFSPFFWIVELVCFYIYYKHLCQTKK